MKKLLYINLDFFKYQNKAKAQIKAFEKLKNKVEVATINNKEEDCYFEIYEYKNNEFNLKSKQKLTKSYKVEQGNNSFFSLWTRLRKTVKINKLFKKEVINYIENNQFDYCYIRRIGFFVIFLTSMFKRISNSTKILYEIPTYPLDKYDSFLINFSQKIEMFYFNLFIKKYITLIPVILQNDIKLDPKMISISNGIDYNKFQHTNDKKPVLDNTFHMLIVAHVLPWHGYDRLIKSIKEYQGKKKIVVDIYGDKNQEIKNLEELTKQLNLTKQVHFKGEEKLENILKRIDKYHIAIGSLGYHRRDGKYDTSIKNKEYCAMGLPFITSSIDLSFPKDFKYLYKVESNDNTFEIEKIIDWYQSISKENYKKEMKKYAKEHLEYEFIYKKVFDKLK